MTYILHRWKNLLGETTSRFAINYLMYWQSESDRWKQRECRDYWMLIKHIHSILFLEKKKTLRDFLERTDCLETQFVICHILNWRCLGKSRFSHSIANTRSIINRTSKDTILVVLRLWIEDFKYLINVDFFEGNLRRFESLTFDSFDALVDKLDRVTFCKVSMLKNIEHHY